MLWPYQSLPSLLCFKDLQDSWWHTTRVPLWLLIQFLASCLSVHLLIDYLYIGCLLRHLKQFHLHMMLLQDLPLLHILRKHILPLFAVDNMAPLSKTSHDLHNLIPSCCCPLWGAHVYKDGVRMPWGCNLEACVHQIQPSHFPEDWTPSYCWAGRHQAHQLCGKWAIQ